jgi:hypothetical protein
VVIELDSADAIAAGSSEGTFLVLMLLYAIAGKWDVLHFEPCTPGSVLNPDDPGPPLEGLNESDRCRICYHVCGRVQELESLPTSSFWVIWWLATLRETWRSSGTNTPSDRRLPPEALTAPRTLHLKLGPASVMVSIIVEFTPHGARADLTFHPAEGAAERARQLLTASHGPLQPCRRTPGRVPLLPRVRDVWPWLFLHLYFLPLLALVSVSWFFSPEKIFATLPAGVIWSVYLFATWRSRGVWTFGRQVRAFLTLSSKRIVLRYAPLLQDQVRPEKLLTQVEEALSEVEKTLRLLRRPRRLRGLGFPIRRKVYVYVVPDGQEVPPYLGKDVGGRAVPQLLAIIVRRDARTLWLDEVLQHEFVHLFAGRWNPFAAPFWREGLATWLQRTWGGIPIDDVARCLLRSTACPIRPYLHPKAFHQESYPWTMYMLAGSFTGFLVWRFGWDRYERFYRAIGKRRFEACFSRHFGVPFDAIEKAWRQKLLASP